MKAEDQIWALQELVAGEHLTLKFQIAHHCRCMSCWVYTFTDTDGKDVLEEDTLERLIEGGVKLFNVEV